MTPQDEATLKKLLNTDVLPKNVVQECNIRTHLYHSNGGSGPLGTLALIDLIRFINATLPQREAPTYRTDWHRVPRDTPVRAYDDDDWIEGTFQGISKNARLWVKRDDTGQTVQTRVVETIVKRLPDIEQGVLDGGDVDWRRVQVGVEVWGLLEGVATKGKVTELARDARGPMVTWAGAKEACLVPPHRLSLRKPAEPARVQSAKK